MIRYRYERSIWAIDIYGRSDVNEISIGLSICNMGCRCKIRYIDMVIHQIDMIILDIDMRYGLMIWDMTVSIRSSSVSIWDILSPYPHGDIGPREVHRELGLEAGAYTRSLLSSTCLSALNGIGGARRDL